MTKEINLRLLRPQSKGAPPNLDVLKPWLSFLQMKESGGKKQSRRSRSRLIISLETFSSRAHAFLTTEDSLENIERCLQTNGLSRLRSEKFHAQTFSAWQLSWATQLP